MTRIGIGLIGLGRHGMRYVRHLLQDVPTGKLVAVCRRSATDGARFAAEHGVHYYRDYHSLIGDPAVEAIIVVTPPVISPAICQAAVRAGKPLLIEKPLATTGVEAHRMVQSADQQGVPLMTAQTLRFEPTVRALKERLSDVGPPRYLVLTSRVEPRPGTASDPADYGGRGVLLEVGIHLLDLIRFLTNEDVREVRCEMEKADGEASETRAHASLRTTGGVPCIVDVSRMAAGRVGRVEWIGRDGQLVADWSQRRLVTLNGGVKEENLPAGATIVDTLQTFLGALKDGLPMPITGLDGQRAVEIADACYESAASGNVVTVQKQD